MEQTRQVSVHRASQQASLGLLTILYLVMSFNKVVTVVESCLPVFLRVITFLVARASQPRQEGGGDVKAIVGRYRKAYPFLMTTYIPQVFV